MSKPEEIGPNELSSFTDEQIRLYLLCRLNEGDRVRLEERLLADDDLVQRTRLAEVELSDDYAADSLSAVERDFFEKKFLVSEGRRDNLRVSRALRKHAALVSSEAIREEKPSWIQGVLTLFSFKRSPVFATAAAMAFLILAVGSVLFIVRQMGTEQQFTASHESVSSPQVNVNQGSQSPPIGLAPSPEPSPARKPATPPEPQTPPVVATFTLFPGSLRGSGDLLRVVVPNGKLDVVRLILVPEADGHGLYSAQLLSAEGKTILTRARLQIAKSNSEPRLVLNIPASLLIVGDYQIKLSRQIDGKTEPVGSYYFRALQK